MNSSAEDEDLEQPRGGVQRRHLGARGGCGGAAQDTEPGAGGAAAEIGRGRQRLTDSMGGISMVNFHGEFPWLLYGYYMVNIG